MIAAKISCVKSINPGILIFYSMLSDGLIEIFLARITTSVLQTEFYIYSHYTFWNWRNNHKMGQWPHRMHCETEQRCNLLPGLHKLVGIQSVWGLVSVQSQDLITLGRCGQFPCYMFRLDLDYYSFTYYHQEAISFKFMQKMQNIIADTYLFSKSLIHQCISYFPQCAIHQNNVCESG